MELPQLHGHLHNTHCSLQCTALRPPLTPASAVDGVTSGCYTGKQQEPQSCAQGAWEWVVVDGAAVVVGAWHAEADAELRQVCTTSEASSAVARMSKQNRKPAAMHAQFIATCCDST